MIQKRHNLNNLNTLSLHISLKGTLHPLLRVNKTIFPTAQARQGKTPLFIQCILYPGATECALQYIKTKHLMIRMGNKTNMKTYTLKRKKWVK